jgi:diguanylate cyclase (GGDEF)-like protein
MLGSMLLLLGFGAPIGSILFRGLMAGPFGPGWIRTEVHNNAFYYAYMTFTTPAVFALFGFFLGHFIDQFFEQKAFLQAMNDQLKEQSIMDDITGLYNHRHILAEIEKELERARRYKHTLAGMMIDVDDFKSFNDKLGHLTGDYVLREVAHVFQQSIRKIDIVGRYGGDEFLIILPEANEQTARVVADRIQRSMAAHGFVAKKRPIQVTVSIGLFYFPSLQEVDALTFIEKIDKALLKAKGLGKNRIQVMAD